MAEQEIFKGLVSVEVNGTGAVEQVADMVETIRAKLLELGTSEVELGNVRPGSTAELDVAIKRIREYATELRSTAKQQLEDSRMLGATAETDVWRKQLTELKEVTSALTTVARLTREVKAAQAESSRGAGAGPVVDVAALQAENERLRAAGAGGNGGPPRDGGPAHPTPEEPESGGYRPRPALVLDEAMRTAVPDEMALQEDPLKQRMSRVTDAYDSAAAGLERNYKTQAAADAAENRYKAAAEALTQSSIKLAAAENKQADAAVTAAAAEEAREAAKASPLHALLAQNNDSFLAAQGLDPNMPASRLKNAKALQDNAAAQTELEAQIEVAANEQELAKLVAKRRTLATQQIALTEQQNRLMEQENAKARGNGGFLGGLLTQNKEDGSLGGDLAGQAGITLKYFALYSAFSAVEKGLREVIRQAEQFSLEVNQLAIAMHTGTDEASDAAKQYMQIGASYGVDPLVAISAGTKVGRTFPNEDGSYDMAAGRAGARLGSIISTLDPKEEQKNTLQDTIAVAKSFNVTAQGLVGVYDQILTVGQKYGYQTVGEVVPGVAQISDIGHESGFSIPQLTALVATVMQRTGETSDGAAGDLKRLLGSENATSWTGLDARYNIDMSQSFNDRITQLAKAMKDVPQDERTRELTSLGGPRIAAAVQAIFDGRTQANQAVSDANKSPGTAEEQAQKKLESLGGEFQKLGGELQGLFLALAESGIGDAIGAFVIGVTDVVTVLRNVIDVWDEFPGVIKDTAAALALLAAASKLQAMLGSGNGPGFMGQAWGKFRAGSGEVAAAEGGLRTAEGAMLPEVATGLAMASGAPAAGAVAAEGLAAPVAELGAVVPEAAAGVGGLASGLGVLLTALGPVAIGIAAIAAAAEVFNETQNVDKAHATLDDATAAAKKALASGDPQQVADALSALQAGQKGVKDLPPPSPLTVPGLASRAITWGVSTFADATRDPNQKPVDTRTDDQKLLAQIQAWQAAHKDDLSGKTPGEKLFGSGYSGLSQGIEILTQRGMGPSESTDLLGKVFAQGGNVVSNLLHPLAGQKGAADWQKQIMTQVAAIQDPSAQVGQYGNLASVLGAAKTQIEGTGNQSDIASITLLYNEVTKAWTSALVNTTKMRIDAINSDFTGKGSGDAIKGALTDALNKTTGAGDINATIQLMNGANKKFIDDYIAGLKAEKAALDAQRAALVEAATEAERLIGSSSDIRAEQRGRQVGDSKLPDDSKINAQIAAAQKAAGLATPGNQDFSQQNALDIAKINENVTPGSSHSAAKAAVDAAQAKVDQLNSQGKNGTADYYDALKALNDSKYALAENEKNAANAAGSVNVESGNSLAQATDAVAVAKRNLDFAVKGTQEYDVALKAYHDAQYALAQAQLAVSNAELAAAEIPGDPASAATIAIKQAEAILKATHDPTAYWNAKKQLAQSQYDLAKIDLQNATAQESLHSDMTDPVVQARAKLDEAKRQLAFDQQRGAGKDVILQDQVNVKQDTSDYSGAKWQQKFSDQQTDYDLYREPLSAYLKYLRSQHDYLSAIKVKTRQQVDELNEVDKAMKGLMDGLNGQWNLGDIKVPTAYEMRRQLQGGMASTTAVSYVNIQFTAGTAEDFKGVLETYVGQPVMQTVGTTPVKV